MTLQEALQAVAEAQKAQMPLDNASYLFLIDAVDTAISIARAQNPSWSKSYARQWVLAKAEK